MPRDKARGRGLVWRAIRWRLGTSVVFFLVGAAAVAAASAGPIYLAAADQSVVNDVLAAAPPASKGLTLTALAGTSASITPGTLRSLASKVPGGTGSTGRTRFGSPLLTVDVSSGAAEVVSRTGVCQQLKMISGHCPAAMGDTVLSSRSAHFLHLDVGSVLTPASKQHSGRPLKVVGIYEPPADSAANAYWWGANYFPYGAPYGRYNQLLDAEFVSFATAESEAEKLASSDWIQLPLRSQISASAAPRVEADLAAYDSRLRHRDVGVASGLTGLLGNAAAEEHEIREVVAVISLELVLLALLVLYSVAAANSAERQSDIAIAELRGHSRRSVAFMALREPAVLLAAAAPLGLFGGWLAVMLASSSLFAPGVSVKVDSLSVAVAVAALIAGFLASVLGARGLLRPSRAEEGRAESERRAARSATLLDVMVLALGVAAIVELVGSRSAQDPLAAFAPALIALVAGVLAARLLPFAAGLLVRATRWSRHIATSLATRSLMRRRSLSRRMLALAIAAGLLTFSVAGVAVSSANRRTQSQFSLGAPVVLSVQAPLGVDLVQAVRKADPSGHEAMAVAKVSSPNGVTLGVDSSRLASVGAWPTETSSCSCLGKFVRYLFDCWFCLARR
ncbi:MAG: FtsX-like permease family protein, partial [Acidimicrobiales bacterium]